MLPRDFLSLPFYFALFSVFSALFGACVGSFLNVCIYRMPREESVVRPRSHCPHCGVLIPWHQNIPVVSWVFLRGKCASCKGPIAMRYILVELLTATLFLAVFLKWAIPDDLHLISVAHPAMVPVYWLFIAGLILGTFIDFDHYILPDTVTVGGMVVGPLLSMALPVLHGREVWWQGGVMSLLGMAVGFGLLLTVSFLGEKAFKKEAMGFGDVKLIGAIGAFLGWKAVLFTIFVSSFLGSVIGLLLILFRRGKLQGRIPFGPYLSMGAVIWIFYGSTLVGVYLRLMR